MAESLYNIVFRGELVSGADPAVVRQNLAKAFRMDADKVEKLFSGKPVVLKKNADKATAMKFRAVMKKAGAQCEMKPVDEGAGGGAEAPASSAAKERASFAARDPDTRPLSEEAAEAERRRAESRTGEPAAESAGDEVEEIEAAPPPEPAPRARARDSGPPPDSDLVGTIRMGGTGFSGEFEVAPAGADMGEAHDRGERVEPDISHLSLAPPGSDLEELHPDRKVEVPDISHLKVVEPDKENEDSR